MWELPAQVLEKTERGITVEAMNRLKKLFGFEHQTEPEQEAEETKEDSE